MERFLNEVQEFVQRCLDGKNSSNVTVIMNESYYEQESDNGDKSITIRTRDVNKRDNNKDLDYYYCQESDNGDKSITIRTRDVNKNLDNDKEYDYFYCQECGRKVYFSKNSMFMPHPKLCSNCESHNF